jgi:hypothetical protein
MSKKKGYNPRAEKRGKHRAIKKPNQKKEKRQ